MNPMSISRWPLVLSAALLAAALGWSAPGFADEEKGKATSEEEVPAGASVVGADREAEKATATVEEAEAVKPEEPQIVETELTPEELWQLVNPWEEEGVEVHGAESRGGESQIRTHGGDSPREGIPTHTQTSGDEERIPVTRIGESNDAGIVVHGGGSKGPSRIRVH
jgi:hypothetical protein